MFMNHMISIYNLINLFVYKIILTSLACMTWVNGFSVNGIGNNPIMNEYVQNLI